MLDARQLVGIRVPALWLGVPIGAVAGGLAVALLLITSPPIAAAALVGLIGAVMMLAAPHAGLYAVVAATIAQWPGQLIKFAGIGLTLSCLLWALTHRRRLIPRDRLFLVLTVYVAIVWLSVLRAGGDVALNTAITQTTFLGLYWTLSTMSNSPTVARRLILAMVASGLVTAAIAMIQFKYPFVWVVSASRSDSANPLFQGGDWYENLQWEGVFRVESLTGTPDYLGLTMQILLPFPLIWAARQRSTGRRMAGLAATLALFATLLLSFTRGVMFSTATIVAPYLAQKLGWRRSLPYLILGAVLVGGLAFAWAPFRARAESIVTEWLSPEIASSGGWRREILPIAWQMFLDHFWTGVGIGHHRSLWREYVSWDLWLSMGGDSIPMHNSYMLVAIETGVSGIAVTLLLILMAWWRLRQLQAYFHATGQHGLADLARAAEVAWVALAFNIALYPVLEGAFRYIWLLLAFIGALSRVAIDQRDGSGVREAAGG